MLPEKPEYKILRLNNGEVLISMVKIEKNRYILYKPMKILSVDVVSKNMEVKNTAVILKEWMEFSSDESYSILKSVVMTVGVPDDDVVDLYNTYIEQESVENLKHDMMFGPTGNIDEDDGFTWRYTPRNFPD